MILIVLLVGAAAIVLLSAGVHAADASPPRRQPRPPTDEDLVLDAESPADMALGDPVGALLRYGTPADAARLAEQGVDLSALGYRPPGAR